MSAVAAAGPKPILPTPTPVPMTDLERVLSVESFTQQFVIDLLKGIEKTLERGLSLKANEVESTYDLLFKLAELKGGLSVQTREVLGRVFYNAFAASCTYSPEGRNDNPVLVPHSIRSRAFDLCKRLLRDDATTIPFRTQLSLSLPYIMNHPETSYEDQKLALAEMSASLAANPDCRHTAFETCCKLDYWDVSLKQHIAKNLLNDPQSQKKPKLLQFAGIVQTAAETVAFKAGPLARLGIVRLRSKL